MRLLKLVLGLLALALLCLSAARAEQGSTRKIVVFSASTPVSERIRIASTGGAKVVRTLDLINAVVVETAAGEKAFASLKSNPKVARVDEDPKIDWLKMVAPERVTDVRLPDVRRFARFHRDAVAARALSNAVAGADLPWWVTRLNVPAAWAVTKGAGVKVAVIDTGIDRNHPDLKERIAGGWNAITKGDDFTDDNGHGSHVTGTIVAKQDDQNGVVGVAPEASIYGVKVLDSNGSGTFDDVIAGMQWAVEHHMQIASMSLGARKGNDSLKAAVEAMAKNGVALIAAAGNSGPGDNTIGYPAAYPGAIAVAAIDKNDAVADFSSRGQQVAIAAPGVDIKSTYMNGGFETLSGTSMATPHVSGLAALAVAAKGLSGVDAVRAALVKAATPLANGAPATQQGAGVPDAFKLVR